MPNLPMFAKLFLFLLLLLRLGGRLPAQAGDAPLSWREALRQDSAWYGGAESIRIAQNLIVYQHETGGWPKNTDMAKDLSQAEIIAIRTAQLDPQTNEGRPTIDNKATYTQMRFLARVYGGSNQPRFKASFLKGLDYLLEAQYENGGWPQFYPLRTGYYDHITFNDGAMMGVVNLLDDIAQGAYPFVDAARQAQAQVAINQALGLILRTQVVVDGHLTAWCAQYDAETLTPADARAYELRSISGAESVAIVAYLMDIEYPREAVIRAVQAAVHWFERVAISSIRLIKKADSSLPKGYDLVVGFDPEHASPLWARFYEIGSNYPMFVDRDGVITYALSEISYERRVGYAWLGGWANNLIEIEYPAWCRTWELQPEK
jgi:PelA/Pel-15E family pectate lyase